MPELPEVETVMRGLTPALLGRKIRRAEVRRPDLRFPFPPRFAERLQGRCVTGLRRRAKYILVDLDGGESLVIHLGMSGRMVIIPKGMRPAPDPHDHVMIETDAGDHVIFNDPRRFGLMDLMPTEGLDGHKYFSALGPEPLDGALTADYLLDRFKGKKTSIKAALLDQRLLVGVGNIYASEALFRAGIRPRRMAGRLSRVECDRLARAVIDTLSDAIAAGGSSLRDYRQASGELGYFQHAWRVYGRADEACRACGDTIRHLTQGGRSTFYCPTCQR